MYKLLLAISQVKITKYKNRANSILQALQDEFTQKKVLYAGELFAGKFYPVKCDVTKDEEIQKAFEWINDNLKSVSILVNGAGILEAQDKDIESQYRIFWHLII